MCSFRAAFFALPPEKQAPRPSTVEQSLSLANKAAEIQSTFARLPSSSQLARPQAAKPVDGASAIQTYPHLDPNFQPMRHELQNIIDLYLQPHSLSPITSLISPNTLRKALSQAKLTTHPSALDPVASVIHSHLTTEILPQFLDHAVSNLSATTSRGRMIVACIAAIAALILEVFLILYRTSRVARLLALPLWILAIGYAIGSRTGLCFWLAMRGTREHKSYESPSLSTRPNSMAAHRLSLASIDQEPKRPSMLLARISRFTWRATSADTDHSESMAEKGTLSSGSSPGAATDDKRFSHKSRTNHSREFSIASGSVSSVSSRQSLLTSVRVVKRIVRLTGTAVDTVPVEDSRVRKLQAMVGLRVAIWLFLGTSVVIGVIMAIP
ncbi:hypothetical protein FRC09_017635 [Ceratobasidium sp. 395]|nr:hypothetical protein FRC09_017635 [Ceratobasidium sp. 395]